MDNKLKVFKKILGGVIILEIFVIIGPWLVFVPVVSSLFSDDFAMFGWIYSMFGIIALAPTLIIYAIVNHFESKNNDKFNQMSKVDRVADKVAWILIVSLILLWALSITDFFDLFL